MLEIAMTKSTAQSNAVTSQNTKKSAGELGKSTNDKQFQAEYDAARKRNEKQNEVDDTRSAANSRASSTENPETEAADTVTDESDLVTTPDSDEAETEIASADDFPDLAVIDAKKSEPATTKTPSGTAEADLSRGQTGIASNQILGTGQNGGSNSLEKDEKAPATPSLSNGSTAETVVMSKAAVNSASAVAPESKNAILATEKPTTSPPESFVQKAQPASPPIGGNRDGATVDDLTENARSKNRETDIHRRGEVHVDQTSQPPKSTMVAAQPTVTQIQALAKLEASKDKADLLPVGLTEVESLGSLETRQTTQNTTVAANQILTRTDTSGMIARQMAEALQRLPDRPVEISLNPSELGRVRMSISAAEAGITVSVIAERPETLDLMRRNIDQLTREFQAIGYSDINFAFSEGAENHSFGDESAERKDDDITRLDLTSEEASQPLQQISSASTGVDIRL